MTSGDISLLCNNTELILQTNLLLNNDVPAWVNMTRSAIKDTLYQRWYSPSWANMKQD